MFDIRPVSRSGVFDYQRFSRLASVINLKSQKAVERIGKPVPTESYEVELTLKKTPDFTAAKPPFKPRRKEKDKLSVAPKELILGEIESVIASPVNVAFELERLGGTINHKAENKKPRRWIYPPKVVSGEDGINEKTEINFEADKLESREDQLAPSSSDGEFSDVELVGVNSKSVFAVQALSVGNLPFRKIFIAIFLVGLGWLGVGLVSRGELSIKNSVLENGKNAVANLMDAKESLKELRFSSAADSFTLAYDDFSKASTTLNELGASFAPILSKIPGLNKIATASNIVIAGRDVAKAGQELSSAFDQFYKTNVASFLSAKTGDERKKSLFAFFDKFNKTLISARKSVNDARGLMATIDSGLLPADKKPLFDVFKNKLPELNGFLDKAVGYSGFLTNMVGGQGDSKKYLILLQNNSELRATGGFPGTYAIISFEDGFFKDIKVDDIYNPDGQLKEFIVPPKPLQHITPTWGMRDANWFADFPTSAKKVMEFYKKDTGISIDGVITLTPDVIVKIMDIIGPIEMPEYGVTLNAKNFLSQVQEEVEYGGKKSEEAKKAPKKILVDFEPKFLAELGRQGSENWIKIFSIFSDALEQKHILAYFNESSSQRFALENGFGGEIKDARGDYLEVVFSNVKGSKTDAVTENRVSVQGNILDNGSMEHLVEVKRTHNGGDSEFGFYNRPNPSYIRLYVPLGARLVSINGNTTVDFSPIIDYSTGDFKHDQSLLSIESQTTHPFDDVDVFQENGKTVFGFWLVVGPKEAKSAAVKYIVPANYVGKDYNFLLQKQSGTGSDKFSLNLSMPGGRIITGHSDGTQIIGGKLVSDFELLTDKSFRVTFE